MAHAKCCNFDRMVEKLYGGEQWRRSKASVFWGKIAPCDHVVQIYENEQNFIHVLAQFVISGLEDGDGVIVIATSDHLLALNALFNESGINTDRLTDTQYFPLVAEKVLEKFMVNGWPNEKLFNEIISSLIRKVRNNNRKVRAFGEMVAILWQQGHSNATGQLERLWSNFCTNEMFCLFCAYPKSSFHHDINSSLEQICSEHSKLLASSQSTPAEIVYSRLQVKKVV